MVPNRIRELREQQHLSQEALGEKLGVHWQTIHRLETGKSALTASKERAVAAALGVEPSDLRIGGGSRLVIVKGYVQAGAFAETWEWDEDRQYPVYVPGDPDLRTFALYGAETRGPSMDRRYPEGTILIFTDVVETGEKPQPGRRYIIERERADGLREATVKTLWRDNDGALWLLPESNDPRFQEPIPIEGNSDDTIRILGRVRYAVSRE